MQPADPTTPAPDPNGGRRATLSPATPGLLLLLAIGLGAAACGGDEDTEDVRADAADIPAPAFPTVSDDALARGAGEDWPLTGGDLMNRRYSPLDQIDRQNVVELVPVWVHSTGIEGALESTPVVVGNTMYVTTAGGRVLALNAATGEELWVHDPAPASVTLCCGPTNQGVAVYGGRVYVAALDARIIALDARSGIPVWQEELADPEAGYSATSAPLAVDGRVFVGVGGERYGVRGFLAAFDAGSGEELWRWHTIPSDEEEGWWGEWTPTDPFGTSLDRDLEAEREDSAVTSESWNVGGGGITTTPAYDPDAGLLFVNVEAPAPTIAGSIRPGDNLYTGSIVALDVETGERAWHAQYLPHDVWGLSGGSPPFLFDQDGRRLVGFAGRTGWVYIFDARTGEPVLRSDNFVPQEGLFTRPDEERPVRIAPGANGGNAGAPVAYAPNTGTAFVAGVHQPMVLAPDPEPYERGALWLGGDIRFGPDDEHWGTVSAIDLATGRIRWQRRTPAPVHSGILATAGGLVFVGQGDGAVDAFDADDGRLLWQFRTAAGVHGGAVSYSVGGVQYIAVPAGGSFHFGTAEGDDIIAFALASRRPSLTGEDYAAADFPRGGPATPGTAEVRDTEPPAPTGPADTADPEAAPEPEGAPAPAPEQQDTQPVIPEPEPEPEEPEDPEPEPDLPDPDPLPGEPIPVDSAAASVDEGPGQR